VSEGCARSHPHELMDEVCERKTGEARDACLGSARPPVVGLRVRKCTDFVGEELIGDNLRPPGAAVDVAVPDADRDATRIRGEGDADPGTERAALDLDDSGLGVDLQGLATVTAVETLSDGGFHRPVTSPSGTPCEALVKAREHTHGRFEDNSRIFAGLLASAPLESYPETLRYAVAGIYIKLARMSAGDGTFPGHAEDIEGYARLIREAVEAGVVEEERSHGDGETNDDQK
jgi:hypothetical protein